MFVYLFSYGTLKISAIDLVVSLSVRQDPFSGMHM